jgi:hypothetical protein
MFHQPKVLDPKISKAIAAFMARRSLVVIDAEEGVRQYQRCSKTRRRWLKSKGLLVVRSRKAVR